MDPVKITLVSLAVLPLGLGSIHAAETLRWYEPRRGLVKIILAALAAFAGACALLTLYRKSGDMNLFASPEFSTAYIRTVLQMLFAAYFLVALAYLLHCITWVLTRLGRRVFLDELFSRLLALALFAAVDLCAYLALALIFGF